MRPSSRLITVWTGVTLVVVGAAWLALSSAVSTAVTDPGSFSELNPVELAPSPSSVAASTTPSAAPTATPSHSSRPSPTASVHRSPRPHPPRGTPPPTPSQPASPSPSDVVRTLRAEGGSATVTYSGGKVDLVDYSPHFGYLVDAYRDNDQSITVRFLGFFHVSTVQAFVDSKKTFQTTVKEEAS